MLYKVFPTHMQYILLQLPLHIIALCSSMLLPSAAPYYCHLQLHIIALCSAILQPSAAPYYCILQLHIIALCSSILLLSAAQYYCPLQIHIICYKFCNINNSFSHVHNNKLTTFLFLCLLAYTMLVIEGRNNTNRCSYCHFTHKLAEIIFNMQYYIYFCQYVI